MLRVSKQPFASDHSPVPREDAERWRGEPSPISTTLTGLHGPNPVRGAAQALEQDLLQVANQPRLKLCPASLHTELQPANWGGNGLSIGCCSRDRGQRGGFWLRCQVPARPAVAGLGGPILQGLSPWGCCGSWRGGQGSPPAPRCSLARRGHVEPEDEDEGCS